MVIYYTSIAALWCGIVTAALVYRIRGLAVISPVFCVSIWWALWLTISLLIPLGLEPPSLRAVWYFSLFILFILLGGALASGRATMSARAAAQSIAYQRSVAAIFWLFIMLQLPFTLYFLYKSRSFLGGYLGADIRAVALGIDSGVSSGHAIYGTSFIRNLYDLATGGLNIIVMAFGIYMLIRYKAIICFLAAAMLTGLNQLISLGRMNIYLIALVIVLIALVMAAHRETRALIAWRKLFLVVVASGVLSLSYAVYSFQKREGKSKDMRDLVLQYMDYHMMGFSLFSMELENPASLANSTLGMGNASSSGAQQIIAYAIRRFIPEYMPPATMYSYFNQEFVEIGARDGRPLYYNAYYTILHPLFCDFRLVGVVLFAGMYGWVINFYFTRYRRFGDAFSAAVWIGLLFQGFYMLHYPPTERTSTFTWMALIILLGWAAVARVLTVIAPSWLLLRVPTRALPPPSEV